MKTCFDRLSGHEYHLGILPAKGFRRGSHANTNARDDSAIDTAKNSEVSAPIQNSRLGLAIVLNAITPYHVNLHRLIAAGIPELKLHVLVSHWAADFKWEVPIPPGVHVSRYGAVDEHPLENPLRRPLWGWRKGGRFIRYIRDNRIRAVIVNGYRFISYLRMMNYCHRHGLPFFVNNDSNIRAETPLRPHAALAKRLTYA